MESLSSSSPSSIFCEVGVASAEAPREGLFRCRAIVVVVTVAVKVEGATENALTDAARDVTRARAAVTKKFFSEASVMMVAAFFFQHNTSTYSSVEAELLSQ